MDKKEKFKSNRKEQAEDESLMMIRLEKEIKSKLKFSYQEEKKEEDEENNSSDDENVKNKPKLAAIKLFMIDFKQCDSKRCTGRKLERLRKLKSISHKSKFKGIVLTASAQKLASPEDEAIILKNGICVIDCSWAKINEINFKTPFEHERKLPFVVASNPVNYGVPYKLTCAEAIATALYISGFRDEAEDVMSVFKWGSNFFVLNEDIFNLYQNCKNGKELEKTANDYLELEYQKDEEKHKKKNEDLNLPPNSSDEEEEMEENEKEEEKNKNISENEKEI